MLLLIGSLLQIIYGVNAANEGLIFVQAVWRHGDRAPSKLPYPNDPHGESSWPRGWSQLTNLGMQQMYDLGQFFRRRYGTFVGEDFNLNDVLIRSSSSDRAIVSAQAMLRGFYPANKQTMWLQGELWQPLPFSSVTPGQSDPMLRPTDYSCPTYDTAMQSLGQIAASINSEYADVFEFLVNVTGYNKVEFKQALTLSNIKREVLHNMSQPYWVYEKWPSHGNRTTLQILEKIKRIDRINEFNSSTKAKLRGGLLATDWLNRAINVSLGQQKTPKKMILFSAHDGTVLALMYALNIGNDLLAPYASCLIMELYRTANNETEVKLLYRNETNTDNVYTMMVPGCNTTCTVENLSELMKSEMVNNVCQLRKECGVKGNTCNPECNQADNTASNIIGPLFLILSILCAFITS